MKNTAVAAATKRPAHAADTAEPDAKRSRNDVSRPSWADLTLELIGHIAIFLPMGIPNMMRLLLCVGPRVAAVVRKRYLTGNEYYILFYNGEFIGSDEGPEARARVTEVFEYWMEYNEKAWKRRCLGKAHEENVHSISLTPEQAKSVKFVEAPFGYHFFFRADDLNEDFEMDVATLADVRKFAKKSEDFLLVSVGTKVVVDDGLTTQLDKVHQVYSLIDTAELDGDGKLTLSFMRSIDAVFACPQDVIHYNLVNVLQFMIEEDIVESNTTTSHLRENGDCYDFSLLYHALSSESFECFCHLLSLPGIDINTVSWSARGRRRVQGRECENILHSYMRSDYMIPLPFLRKLLCCKTLDLNALNSKGLHVFSVACDNCYVMEEDNASRITAMRMILKAGADPRSFPLDILDLIIKEAQEYAQLDQKKDLIQLRTEIVERISEGRAG